MGQEVEVLAPFAEEFARPDPAPLAARLATLTGCTVGFVVNSFALSRPVHAELQRRLAGYGIEPIIVTKSYWQALDAEQLERVAAHADAAVGGVCVTSPSTMWAVRDAVELERRGRPTVTLVAPAYEKLFAQAAGFEGMPDLRRVCLPHPAKVADATDPIVLVEQCLPAIVTALTTADGARDAQ